MEEFFLTPTGKRFRDGGFNTEENREIVSEAIFTLYGDDAEITGSVMSDVVGTLFAAGELIAPKEPTIAEKAKCGG